MDSQNSAADQRIRRFTSLVTAALLGLFLGTGAVLAVVLLRHHQDLPKLSPEDFYEAQRKWEGQGPRSYQIEIAVSGRQAARYTVEVRDEEVVAATRDGEALTRQRTSGTWSVPGMLTTIHSDVLNVERHQAGQADHNTPQVLLRGVFDERFGYPRRYHRTEMRKWGANQEVMWEVERFEVLEE